MVKSFFLLDPVIVRLAAHLQVFVFVLELKMLLPLPMVESWLSTPCLSTSHANLLWMESKLVQSLTKQVSFHISQILR